MKDNQLLPKPCARKMISALKYACHQSNQKIFYVLRRESDEECSERQQERDSLQTYETRDEALLYNVYSEGHNSQVQR